MARPIRQKNPMTTPHRLQINITKAQHAALLALHERTGSPMAELVRQAVARFLKENGE